jgi:hypothetical protein
MSDLKKAIISASGGYAVGYYLQWIHEPLWRTIETVELVAMVQDEANERSKTPS